MKKVWKQIVYDLNWRKMGIFTMTPEEARQRGSGPKKRRRTEAELEDAAGRFRETYVTGDPVMFWLRRVEGRSGALSALVREGWSWTDVGLAMARAGITYRTGKPLSATVLAAKAFEARQREQKGVRPKASLVPAEAPTQERRAVMPPSRPYEEPEWLKKRESSVPSEPEFRIGRLRQPYTPPPPQPKHPPIPKAPKRTPEEVRAMLSGSAPEDQG